MDDLPASLIPPLKVPDSLICQIGHQNVNLFLELINFLRDFVKWGTVQFEDEKTQVKLIQDILCKNIS